MNERMNISACMPEDRDRALLVGRAWTPAVEGPAGVCLRGDEVYDLSPIAPTGSAFFELDDPVAVLRDASGLPALPSLAETLANSAWNPRDNGLPWFLAPCDLQAIKASGVTFVSSMLERVIEEQARGDPAKAESVREAIVAVIGDNLASVHPGSPDAMRLKEVLIEQHAWSQYLEVGIGADAEIFTKSQPMSAVGLGAEIGIHPRSEWNNPEPEIVLAVNSRRESVGATLGNDVNLRDIEGRSALLLGKAKDNNASCAIGPFIRLFDASFSLDDLRVEDIALTVVGDDGFVLTGASTMRQISRDPQDLANQTLGANHQYPDGFMLFLGTLFAPVEDRDAPGRGFTHHVGDVVTIKSRHLGALRNRVNTSDRVAPW